MNAETMKVRLNGEVTEVPVAKYEAEAVMHPLVPQPALPEGCWLEVTSVDDGMRSFVFPPEPQYLVADTIDGRTR